MRRCVKINAVAAMLGAACQAGAAIDVVVQYIGQVTSAATGAQLETYTVKLDNNTNENDITAFDIRVDSTASHIHQTQTFSGPNGLPSPFQDSPALDTANRLDIDTHLLFDADDLLTASGDATEGSVAGAVANDPPARIQGFSNYFDSGPQGIIGSMQANAVNVLHVALLPGSDAVLTGSAVYFGGPPLTLASTTFQGPQWVADAPGNWHTSSNWSGEVPNAAGADARFLSAITAPRTVTLDAAATVGFVRFNNTNSYKIDGTQTLRFQVGSGQALVQVISGTHDISVATLMFSDTTLDVTAGAILKFTDAVTISANRTVSQTGAGTVSYESSVRLNIGSRIHFGNSSHLTGLTMGSNSLALVTAGGDVTLRTNNLTSGTTSKIDLADNDFIVDGGSYSTIQSKVIQGFNGGDWLGNGITSSSAANDTNFVTALGIANNADLGYSSFGGFTNLNGDEILVKHTYYGDADLGGTVNLDDFTQFLFGYNNGVGGQPAIWLNGDFDYNGSINLDDFTLFLSGLQNQGGALISPELFTALNDFVTSEGIEVDLSGVPEPQMALLAVGSMLLPRRRRG